ncbi:MAG: hypothetical protein COA80_16060 [Leeuwenhoekiella sp.]|nr:MAG: hypothetical protein COA80_16060 [Leeuwenhoekiella sp.]
MTAFSIILQGGDGSIAVPLIYIEIFILMLTSFLIGYFFAFFSQKSKYLKKITILRKRSELQDHEENYFLDEEEDEELEELVAAQTPEDSVQSKSKQKSGVLDFERLGTADAGEADDLQKIIGIGPYTEEKLNTIGIYTFEQISRFNEADIELVTELIQFFPDRIKNDNWVSKAKMLLESKRRTQLRRESPRMKRA